MPELPPSTDDKPVFDALREAGVAQDLAYRATHRIRDMAAANVIARLDAEERATRRVVGVVVIMFAVLASIVIGIATVVFSNPRPPAIMQQAPGDASPATTPSDTEGNPPER